MIKLYTLLGKSFSEILEDWQAVYGDSCLSNGAILKWMNPFNDKQSGIRAKP